MFTSVMTLYFHSTYLVYQLEMITFITLNSNTVVFYYKILNFNYDKNKLKNTVLTFCYLSIFIGLGINSIVATGFQSGINLFYQISPIIPFAFSAFIFGRNIYSKKAL